MGAGYHGGFGGTAGNHRSGLLNMNLQFFASKAFEPGGHISEESFSKHGEYFLGKSPRRIEKALQQQGYLTHIEKSKHAKSKAKRIIVENPSVIKNITVVQVSPGSKRHGETPYVKVSTLNSGKYKIVSKKDRYRSDGHEKAKVYYARRKEK